MKVLIPVQHDADVFHHNLFRAPNFALFSIDSEEEAVYYTLEKMIANPFYCEGDTEQSLCQNHGICDPESCTVAHFNDHFALSQTMKRCDYILADYHCDTMTKALHSERISIYKISPFLRTTDIALKNFILGVSYANTLQDIHART